ncbi:MAG: TIGR04282 family arsenosugar biosynthesis glycosyltransferase [Thiogranum sp.]|nr:TIGR04282 family arsenosugar biosynthesis glycosyltransferase [Thiogranum sp.]
MQFPDGRILVFARAPVAGYAKTRLIPELGAAGAAALQAQLVRDTLAMATESGLAPVELWTCGDDDEKFLPKLGVEFECKVNTQQGDDLGARMAHALAAALRTARFAVLIGTDCPAMDAHYLQGACAALHQGSDAVLGPAEDGGYVLIGVRRSDAALFSGIAWGTAQVLAQTRARLAQLNWRHAELAVQWDLDRPADLERLARLDPRCAAFNREC